MRRPLVLPDGWEPLLRAVVDVLDPAWAPLPLVPLGAGMDFWVVALGDDLVVRCPQHDEAAALAGVQRRALPMIASHVTIAVPRPQQAAVNPLGPGDLDVFTRVPGESFDDETWHAAGWLADDRNAAIVARTLDELAAVPVEEARRLGVAGHDLRRTLVARAARVRSEVAPRLPAEVAARLLDRWERFVADDANFSADEVVLHADISLDHLLVSDGVITGLIDFGDLAIGDPDYELFYLHADAGGEFLSAVLRQRGSVPTRELEAKLAFFELNDHVVDVLWALDHSASDLLAPALTALTALSPDSSPEG